MTPVAIHRLLPSGSGQNDIREGCLAAIRGEISAILPFSPRYRGLAPVIFCLRNRCHWHIVRERRPCQEGASNDKYGGSPLIDGERGMPVCV
jgi:hypothetical protein